MNAQQPPPTQNILPCPRTHYPPALGAVDVPDSDNGLVGEPVKPAQYQCITGEADDYGKPDKPLPYDNEIDHNIMSPDDVKIAEAEHLQKLTSWHVWKGTLLGVPQRVPFVQHFFKHKNCHLTLCSCNLITDCYPIFLQANMCFFVTSPAPSVLGHYSFV